MSAVVSKVPLLSRPAMHANLADLGHVLVVPACVAGFGFVIGVIVALL